ncbi:hypothetical protein HPP92_022502 [Vanilla planifolia]|uniref:Uncharacterized protein n=1 Tax=Vanilla planifolia TaxID=51239 RepID=A0A835UDP5_VANPL|nr:hypothetical protein HPP92_022502 [Vanilla planifolia]
MALNVSYPLVFLTIFLLFFAISASITEGNSTSLPREMLGSRPSAGHCFKGPRKSKACDDWCKQLNYYGGMIIKRRRRAGPNPIQRSNEPFTSATSLSALTVSDLRSGSSLLMVSSGYNPLGPSCSHSTRMKQSSGRRGELGSAAFHSLQNGKRNLNCLTKNPSRNHAGAAVTAVDDLFKAKFLFLICGSSIALAEHNVFVTMSVMKK